MSPIIKEKSTKPCILHDSSNREFTANGNAAHGSDIVVFLCLTNISVKTIHR